MNILDTNTPSIYVACLSSYNAGTLYGAWIDATQTKEEILDEIEKMLAGSSGSPAEEWAIHDYSGFGGAGISEWEPIENIVALACLIEEHGEIAWEVYTHCGEDIEQAQKTITEDYQGSFSSIEDWACEFMNETMEIPQHLESYINHHAFARDAELGGDIFTIRYQGDVHVFWSR